jgi:cellulose synthase/poly-beta-1,6-N-acetylglucosamine synthase-like glycosyltransferase
MTVDWASTVFLFVVYLVYAIEWTFHSNLGPLSTVGGVMLWLLEVFAAVLSCAYLWELCDALGTEQPGALNYALRQMTSEDAEVIGIVDSDYQVEPGWLRRCAPAFADPWIGFVQTPQDYRDWRQARYYRRLYYSYKYFFAVSQPSRNEHDGAIFAGTMGLIRRVALDELGGWDEWCITEDAELSLRLLRAGWHGLHVDESFGRGIMPLTFEALKGQRYRWCFGGIQILRMHWRSMIPGRANRANHLSSGQR